MVVDGMVGLVGSHRDEVNAAIDHAKRGQHTATDVNVDKAGENVAIRIGSGVGRGRVLLIGFDHEQIFMPANREKPVIVPYIEHVPPNVTAGIFWLKNRDPENWRDVQNVNHVLGKYIISDRPMTEEEWARERATVIDEKVVEELPAPRSEYGLQVDTPPLPTKR
jgi:hypothetical protein